MIKTSLITSSTILKSLRNMVDKDRINKNKVDDRRGDKKNLPTFSAL